MNFICRNISTDTTGKLTFAGLNTPDLAREYGTPVYLMDEEKIRSNCAEYRKGIQNYFPSGSRVLFASKACCFTEMIRIVLSEGLFADSVSPGELYTAYKAGADMQEVLFHGNNKSEEDIAFALDHQTGWFAIDSMDELVALETACEKRSSFVNILLRITPGIDPHTYEAVNTGMKDCKFGTAIETGQAEELVRTALSMKHVILKGFHCHVGSMVFEEDIFERLVEVMLSFSVEIDKKTGYFPSVLDIGGGIGVRYLFTQPEVSIEDHLQRIGLKISSCSQTMGLNRIPSFWLEPGRSIVADAGMTLYTVGSVKHIPGCQSYVSVDGGMSDNPRYALYQAPYTCLSAERPCYSGDTISASLVGRCCETGDIIQPGVTFPKDIHRGEIVAVCTTGAYNYSMASNYNRVGRPPVVMIKEKKTRVVVARETVEDMLLLDR